MSSCMTISGGCSWPRTASRDDPYDAAGRRQLARAYEPVEDVAVPFGIEAATWLELHRVAAALREACGPSAAGRERGAGPDDEGGHDDGEVGGGGGGPDEGPEAPDALAARLRDLLRRLV